jgi:hypothetical protein
MGGTSSLSEMIEELQHKILTLNVVSKEHGLVSSNTAAFVHIGPDELRKDLIEIKGQTNMFFIGERVMKNYLLQRVHNSENGLPLHYVFQYEI